MAIEKFEFAKCLSWTLGIFRFEIHRTLMRATIFSAREARIMMMIAIPERTNAEFVMFSRTSEAS